jgi:TonB-dependent receptor
MYGQDTGVSGAIRGVINDEDFGDPLVNARITIQELGTSVQSAEGGVFSFGNVEPGVYTIVVAKPGFIRKIERDILVKAGEVAESSISLAQEVYELDELVVQASDLLGGDEVALLELRQDTASLMDSIGAELLSKAGASDASDALKLVVGATVSEDKDAVVRGLGDRYTVTTLNGGRIPSSNPTKRAVALDLFPTSIVESINVSKTFQPDMQGEATGGAVDIITKSVPDGPILEASTSIGYNSNATGNPNFRTYDGAGETYGLDLDGSRDIPDGSFPNNIPNTPTSSNANRQIASDIANSFDRTMGTKTQAPGPDYSIGFVVGNRFDLGAGQAFGALFTFDYSKSHDFIEGGKRLERPVDTIAGTPQFQDDQIKHDWTYDKGTEDLQVTSALSLGWQPNENHEIQLNLLYNTNTSDTAARFEDSGENLVGGDDLGGGDFNDGDVNIDNSIQHRERLLATAQLRGKHTIEPLNDTEFDWQFGSSYAFQYDPDTRIFREARRETIITVPPIFVDPPLRAFTSTEVLGNGSLGSTPQRIWQDVRDSSHQASSNIKVPFKLYNGEEGYVKSGAFVEHRERDYDINRYRLNPGEVPSEGHSFYRENIGTPLLPVTENIFTGEDLANAYDQSFFGFDGAQLGWHWIPDPVNVIDYEANQLISAIYLMAEIPIHERVKIIGGARIERTEMDINVPPTITVAGEPGAVTYLRAPGSITIDQAAVPINQINRRLRETYVHPAISIVAEPVDDMFVRFAYSQTVARPTFRELAPTLDQPVDEDTLFAGNPNLVMSRSENFDFRWEWFPRAGTVFAASAFYKFIQDPIETVIFGSQDFNIQSKENFPSAEIRGFELEVRQRLDLFHESLKPFSIGANYAFIESEVELPTYLRDFLAGQGNLAREQPVSGTPEYLANADFSYTNSDTRTSVSIFYNLQGETFLTRGTFSIADQNIPGRVKKPVENLSLKISQGIGSHWTVSFKAANLLNSEQTIVQRLATGQESTFDTYKKGIDMSLSVKAAW